MDVGLDRAPSLTYAACLACRRGHSCTARCARRYSPGACLYSASVWSRAYPPGASSRRWRGDLRCLAFNAVAPPPTAHARTEKSAVNISMGSSAPPRHESLMLDFASGRRNDSKIHHGISVPCAEQSLSSRRRSPPPCDAKRELSCYSSLRGEVLDVRGPSSRCRSGEDDLLSWRAGRSVQQISRVQRRRRPSG